MKEKYLRDVTSLYNVLILLPFSIFISYSLGIMISDTPINIIMVSVLIHNILWIALILILYNVHNHKVYKRFIKDFGVASEDDINVDTYFIEHLGRSEKAYYIRIKGQLICDKLKPKYIDNVKKKITEKYCKGTLSNG